MVLRFHLLESLVNLSLAPSPSIRIPQGLYLQSMYNLLGLLRYHIQLLNQPPHRPADPLPLIVPCDLVGTLHLVMAEGALGAFPAAKGGTKEKAPDLGLKTEQFEGKSVKGMINN